MRFILFYFLQVTVAQVPLDPSFEYESVPKLAAFAFLKAKVRNSSPYSLLAGPANVFLDNNFVAKVEQKAIVNAIKNCFCISLVFLEVSQSR